MSNMNLEPLDSPSMTYGGDPATKTLHPEQFADVNTQEGQYGTALQAAVREGDVTAVQMLLEKGAYVNSQGGQFGTALQAAAHEGDTVTVQMLLEKGADVNAQGGLYGTALQAAVDKGDIATVQILLEKGADINAGGGLYGTALQAAARRDDTFTVQMLLEMGADVNAQGGLYGTALQAAARREDASTVQMLLNGGADANARGGYYGTALQAAAWGGNIATVRMLIENGADVDAQGGEYGTALQAAAAIPDDSGVLRALLEEGANVNAQGGYYGNALQAAAREGNKFTVQMLLEKGAHVKARGGYYGTPLHAAAAKGDMAVVQLLLEKQPEINVQGGSAGRTPLHLAVEAGAVSVVAQLLKQGAIADIHDLDDVTPLHLAMKKHDYQSVLLLLSRSTDSLSLFNASTWRKLLPGPHSHIEISIGQSTTIRKIPESEIRKNYPIFHFPAASSDNFDDIMASEIDSKRLFMLADGLLLWHSDLKTGVHCRWWRKTLLDINPRGTQTVLRKWVKPRLAWGVQSNTPPSREVISRIPKRDCFIECCFTISAISLPTSANTDWPTLSSHASQLNIERLEKTFGIAWILVKLHDATASDSVLESKVFFSTSEYAQVPRRATDLFLPLVQQLLQEWNLTLHAAENRLEMKRTELLMANGKNPRLIRDLLGDAQLWDLLRKSCKQQINDLVALQTSYYMSESWAMLRENKSTELDGLKEEGASFRKEIDGLEQVFLEGLKALTETSHDLIQLEFNLTSIGEAQKSTSTNKSMKRLSWITFFFLPLMFISSLFGMNIDVLANNPPWWLYIPFAVVTTFFTLAVWLIFKYNVDLEENIDLGFKRLLKAPALGKSLTKASTDDPSHGNEPQV